MVTIKRVRIALLLCVLFFVLLSTWQVRERTTSWKDPLWVVIYPVNGDGSDTTQQYIDRLSDNNFKSIETFMQQQARLYGQTLSKPVITKLGPEIDELPPKPPQGTNVINVMWWSLTIRYWASRIIDRFQGPPGDIKMFVIYYDVKTTKSLDHSLGLQKGLLGVVNAYASRRVTEYNNIVIAHELLHTVGATDKYDYETGVPSYPDGYAEPDSDPLFPQDKAEIMAGKIPVDESSFEHPRSFVDVLVGNTTAKEINWRQ